MIKGKKVTCKKAEAKQGKIYVGKLPTEGVSVEDIQNYFAQVSFKKIFSESFALCKIFFCFIRFNLFVFLVRASGRGCEAD